ncbi:MAG TPA: LD-carboxypeptidase, partial [Nocardioides sp.]|uniref:S66 peptidase family protein n=1 Tax=Nocardioides sp. TaxID=35761 RepID=UPI002C8A649B
EVLRGWGLDVRPPDPLAPDEHGWLAGTDTARAAALQNAWTDPRVTAVWCSRGGFGSQRVLDLLDWGALAAAGPKWLVGFSDVTALHQAFAARLGVVTVHGPGVAGLADADETTTTAVRALLMEGGSPVLQGRPGGGGDAEGVLVGGNLTLLAAMLGTADARPARDSLVLIEDVAEAPYRLDRALTQLLRAGWFDGVRGVASGSFTHCGEPAVVSGLLRSRLAPLGVPLVHDLPVGHGQVNLPVPLGRRVRLDGDRGTLC